MDKDLVDLLAESASIIERLTDRVATTEQRLIELTPDAELGKLVINDEGLYTMRQAAGHLYDETGLGRNEIFAWLREIGLLSTYGNEWNVPLKRYVEAGYFKMKRGKSNGYLWKQTYVTGKGIKYMRKRWKEYGA